MEWTRFVENGVNHRVGPASLAAINIRTIHDGHLGQFASGKRRTRIRRILLIR